LLDGPCDKDVRLLNEGIDMLTIAGGAGETLRASRIVPPLLMIVPGRGILSGSASTSSMLLLSSSSSSLLELLLDSSPLEESERTLLSFLEFEDDVCCCLADESMKLFLAALVLLAGAAVGLGVRVGNCGGNDAGGAMRRFSMLVNEGKEGCCC
jgi:hypothetical protein